MPEQIRESRGPYRVEVRQIDGQSRYCLSGPGLDCAKSYPWEEMREKLTELAELMNFAWHQGLESAEQARNSSELPK